MYEFPSQKFRLVQIPTRVYYSETRRFPQPEDNSDFMTLTFAMAAAADELICFIHYILQQKMAIHCKRLLGALSSTKLPIICTLVTFSTSIHAFRQF